MPETTFNADAETADVPTMTLGGVVHRGRVLSIHEWFAFKDRLEAQFKREVAEIESEAKMLTVETMEAAQALRLDFLRQVFPKGDIDPIAAIEERGPSAVGTAFDRFFSHMRRAFGAKPQPAPPTPPVERETVAQTTPDGTTSPDKTTSAPSANGSDSPTS